MKPLEQLIKALEVKIRKRERELKQWRKRKKRYEDQLEDVTKLSLDGITDPSVAFDRFCAAHRHDGFTRPQLMRVLRERHIKCGKNFAYQAVKKYESRFIQDGDRFFLRNAGKKKSASPPKSNPRRPGALKGAVEARIKVYKGKFTSRRIYNDLKREQFQFWSKKPNASIANILRKLQKSGELNQTQPVNGVNPAEYEKA
jgi:hypothetical protein